MRTLWLSLALTGCLLSADDFDHDDDGDGIPASEDCDDGDAALGAQAEDADCDGVWTAEDCDDFAASGTAVSEDGDCDGVVAADDCDDAEPTSTVVAEDADCDGVPTADDCDDTDPFLPESRDDLDCDGVPIHAGGGSLLRISAGSFHMGCTSGQSDCDSEDERPVMPVELTYAYYLGVTEVTQQEYERVMGEQAAAVSSCGQDCPVESVTWHMAAAYTNALSSWAGLEECYLCTGSGLDSNCSPLLEPPRCDGYRLPTEAEWEAAARCGEDSLYAGSDSAGSVAWYDENATIGRRVGQLAPNDCGLYDMSGNVWEWVHDWYAADTYLSAGRTDSVGPDHGSSRVRRGGSWSSSANDLRVSARSSHVPTYRNYNQGFRIARTIR